MDKREEIREKHLRANGLSVTKNAIGIQIKKAAYDAMSEYATWVTTEKDKEIKELRAKLKYYTDGEIGMK